MSSNEPLSSPERMLSRSLRSDVGVVALVPDRWSSTCTTRHHVLERLAARFDIVWLEPAQGWREHWLPWHRSAVPAATSAPPAHLHVVASSALLPAVYSPAAVGRWLMQQRVRSACRLLRRRGARYIVLYLWRPEFARALDAGAHDRSCYHVDDDYSFSTVDQPNSQTEVELLRNVDQVIVHSPRLLRKKGQINPQTALVPNGVDYLAFSTPCSEPSDMRDIAHPRVGYTGVIKKQLDIALMLELARRRPDWSFVFVGPTGNLGEKVELWQRLSACANVHVLGSRKAHELPAYMQHFDVNVMCYEVNNYTHSIFPLKLTEYLSAGPPIVSSRVESVLPFEQQVRLASGVDEWEAAVQAGLEPQERSPEAIMQRREAAKPYDWGLLVDRIATLLQTTPSASAGDAAAQGQATTSSGVMPMSIRRARTSDS